MQPQQQRSYDLHGRKLFLALPAYDFKVSLKMAVSLVKLATRVAAHGVDLQIGSICGCSVVSRARNLLADDFLNSDCTDLLFIDSDINFDEQDVFRLLAWTSDPKKGIVAGVPTVRRADKTYIATLDEGEDGSLTMNAMGLVKAKRVATAFMMVRKDVFLKLRDEHPEWRYHDTKAGERMLHAFFDFKCEPQGYMGEDFLFCDRARAAGFEVWVDPTIKLGHMGVMEYMGDFGNDILYPMLKPSSDTMSSAA